MKNPYIASRLGCISNVASLSAEEVLKQCGRNLGNLLFFAAIRRVVKHDIETTGISFKPHEVMEQHDGIVIPAANWLQPKNDFTGLAARIERTDLPCVILGLGAQAASGGGIPKLTPGMLRFLKVVSERSHSLSVRGRFSAEVLDHYGIRNVTETGCPSLLWHRDRPATVSKKVPDPSLVTVNATPSGDTIPTCESQRSALACLVMKFAKEHGHDFVSQTELPILKVLLKEGGGSDAESSAVLEYFFGGTADSVRNYLLKHGKFFARVDDWVAYASGQNFTIGTRLHGVIASILGGTPATLITHDSRTEEMAEFAGIPFVRGQDLLETKNINTREIAAQVNFEHFNARQQRYYENFRQFFLRNDVAHNLLAATAHVA